MLLAAALKMTLSFDLELCHFMYPFLLATIVLVKANTSATMMRNYYNCYNVRCDARERERLFQ